MLLTDYKKISKIYNKSGFRKLSKDEIKKLGLSVKSVYYVSKDIKKPTKRTNIITRRRYETFTRGYSYETAAKIHNFRYKPFKEEYLKEIGVTRRYYEIAAFRKGIDTDSALDISREISKSIKEKLGRKIIRFFYKFIDGSYASTKMIFSGDIIALDQSFTEIFTRVTSSQLLNKLIISISVSIEF